MCTLRPKRYLITGGLGYMGSWLTRHLASAGHTVFVLSRGKNAPDLGAPYTLVQADIETQSPAALAALLPAGLDGCAHAASANEAFEEGYARKALMVNALGTRNLLEALCLKNAGGAALPLVVYLSTFHVYGVNSGLVTEDTPPAPRNDYALTHFFGEEYCRFFSRTQSLPFIIVRPTNGYGAPRTAPFGKWYLLLNDLCRAAFTSSRVVLRSNPAVQRDFIWLGDVAKATEKLLERPDLAGRAFNLASGATVGIGEVAALVARTAEAVLGKEIPLTREASAELPAATPPLQVDNTAVMSELGLTFSSHMEAEIAAIFAFLQRHGPV